VLRGWLVQAHTGKRRGEVWSVATQLRRGVQAADRDAAVAGAMMVCDRWSRGGAALGPLWPLVRAAVSRWCGPRPKRIVTFLFIQSIQKGLELIKSKDRVSLLENFQMKYYYKEN
jgi:hypothetical protein